MHSKEPWVAHRRRLHPGREQGHVAVGLVGEARGATQDQVAFVAQRFIDAGPLKDPPDMADGFLVALALGRDSRLFAAGVDLHGVHDRSNRSPLNPERYELAPDAERAVEVSWESSPVAHVKTWKSPVLIIHGDDDRNVRFSQSTDLVRRLLAAGVEVETLVIVDDTHHWMRYANAVKVDSATAAYLEKKLMPREVTQRDR